MRLNLKNEAQVQDAFAEIMANAQAYDAQARLRGVTVQPMVSAKGWSASWGPKRTPSSAR